MCVISVNMKKVTTREAQHHLSKVLEMVEAGEDVVITRRGKAVARIERYREEVGKPFVVPDFVRLREELGTYEVKGDGENEVLRQRGEM